MFSLGLHIKNFQPIYANKKYAYKGESEFQF